VVTLRKNRRTTGFTEAIQESGYQGIRKGDLVIHVMDAFAGAVGVSDSNGKGTPVYSVCTAKGDYNNYYYAHIVREMARSGFIQSLYRGIRQRSSDFRFEIFAAQYLPVPPREEQDQIVRYLDWQVSKINKLISARKKQIVLLKEQKQAVINEAVTKGLDPAVPMKDSGVEWIGEIPAEWSLVPLYSIAKVISMTNKEDEELLSVYLDEGVIPFSQKEEKRTNPTSKDLSKYQYVRYGNLVLNNQQAWRGSVGVSKFEGIVSPAYIILELSKCLNTDYANLLFRGKNMVYQYGLASKGVGSIQRNLYWPHLKRAFVLLPPLPIQKEIVRYIVKRCAKIDALISNIHSEIALLVEYRTRLISDVVTGQIDVRDIEVPEFEYIADDVDDVSDDENTDLEEIMEEEE
jgi:type I restriction enzyme S subunit